MHENLKTDLGVGRLDLGCVADSGLFTIDPQSGVYSLTATSRPATRFIFELIARLQEMATVPMLDIRAYAAHIP